jgi:cytochrome P450
VANPDEAARSLNLYDPAFTADPHALWRQLREGCPVAHSEEHGGYWILTRYHDIVSAANNTAVFSSRSVTVPRDLGGDATAEQPPITLDPPRHIDFRRLLLPGFSSRKVGEYRPAMERLARAAIATFIADGHCDAALDYARAIPVGVICPLFGVPAALESQFRQWGEQLNSSSDMQAAAAAAEQMAAYLESELDARRTDPRDDIITLVLHSRINGEPLSRAEMLGGLVLILIAGLDTVWNVLSNTLLYLAGAPADRRRLAGDPALIPAAVEEFLRYFAPASPARVSTAEACLDGTVIEADASVMLALPSANRDPAAFDRPEDVLLDRRPNKHLAFGVGPHRCIGAPLARLELEVALTEWLAAIPEFELRAGAAIGYSSGQVWGPHSVPVVFPARPVSGGAFGG